MFEKVNPSHPDKIADRIAGAIVDLAYEQDNNPHIAVEVLIGHHTCYIIIESDVKILKDKINEAVNRIAGINAASVFINYNQQDKHLNDNQLNAIKAGDNGIFKGVPTSQEEQNLTNYVSNIYKDIPKDGKFISSFPYLIACQSNIDSAEFLEKYSDTKGLPVFSTDFIVINPLGYWTGGLDVDSGATNRKLGSDMGRAVTGGGLHGKDLSKGDVALNIWAYLRAKKEKREINFSCAIGDEKVDNVPYSEIVEIAREYIKSIGGFEKFAEWGLIRPE